MDDAGPVIIVTASSRGIGAATARFLAGKGYRLSLMARSPSVLGLASELNGMAVQGSLTSPDDIERCVGKTAEVFGRIDGLVCNTGNAPRGELLDIPDEDWSAGVELILLSAIRLSRLVTTHLVRNGGGSIVHVSSFGAARPDLRFPVSSVMRAGLGAFVKLYTRSYAGHGIRMNCVLPGFMENAPQPTEVISRIPTGRLGSMEELAATIEFLLSPASAYVNGEELLVDGGMTAGGG